MFEQCSIAYCLSVRFRLIQANYFHLVAITPLYRNCPVYCGLYSIYLKFRPYGMWQTENREHYGIFYCPYRDRPFIGLIVTTCREYHELVVNGAGSINDIQNQVFHIT